MATAPEPAASPPPLQARLSAPTDFERPMTYLSCDTIIELEGR
jgi:hypothetical protein